MIDNDFISTDASTGSGRRKRRRVVDHVLATALPHTKKLSAENGMLQTNVNTSNISVERLDAVYLIQYFKKAWSSFLNDH